MSDDRTLSKSLDGTGVHGYRGTWVQGYMGAGVHGCRGTWVQGYMGAGVHGCRGTWVQGYMIFFKGILLLEIKVHV